MVGETIQAVSTTRVLTRMEIIRWWEGLRYRYNAYLVGVGFVSYCLIIFVGSFLVKAGEDFEEPSALIMGPALFLGIANICYTFGWMLDVIAYRGTPRKKLFRAGLIFSVVITALPGVWTLVALLITIFTGRKLD